MRGKIWGYISILISIDIDFLRHTELAAVAKEHSWNAKVCLVGVGCRGVVGRSFLSLLTELDIRGQSLKAKLTCVVWPKARAEQEIVSQFCPVTIYFHPVCASIPSIKSPRLHVPTFPVSFCLLIP